MVKWLKLLDKMRNNPRGDWTMKEIRTIARHIDGMIVTAPTGGSHYGVSHPASREILTIPAKRPIKPGYIKAFVDMTDSIIG